MIGSACAVGSDFDKRSLLERALRRVACPEQALVQACRRQDSRASVTACGARRRRRAAAARAARAAAAYGGDEAPAYAVSRNEVLGVRAGALKERFSLQRHRHLYKK